MIELRIAHGYYQIGYQGLIIGLTTIVIMMLILPYYGSLCFSLNHISIDS